MDVSEQEEESPPLHRLLYELQKSGAIGSDKVDSAEADRADGAVEEDGNSGADSLKLELTAYLDMERPLTEPKWVKSGHVEDWIKGANHHPMAARAGRSSDEPDDASWRTKLKVIDPDTVSAKSVNMKCWICKMTDDLPPCPRLPVVATYTGECLGELGAGIQGWELERPTSVRQRSFEQPQQHGPNPAPCRTRGRDCPSQPILSDPLAWTFEERHLTQGFLLYETIPYLARRHGHRQPRQGLFVRDEGDEGHPGEQDRQHHQVDAQRCRL